MKCEKRRHEREIEMKNHFGDIVRLCSTTSISINSQYFVSSPIVHCHFKSFWQVAFDWRRRKHRIRCRLSLMTSSKKKNMRLVFVHFYESTSIVVEPPSQWSFYVFHQRILLVQSKSKRSTDSFGVLSKSGKPFVSINLVHNQFKEQLRMESEVNWKSRVNLGFVIDVEMKNKMTATAKMVKKKNWAPKSFYYFMFLFVVVVVGVGSFVSQPRTHASTCLFNFQPIVSLCFICVVACDKQEKIITNRTTAE